MELFSAIHKPDRSLRYYSAADDKKACYIVYLYSYIASSICLHCAQWHFHVRQKRVSYTLLSALVKIITVCCIKNALN